MKKNNFLIPLILVLLLLPQSGFSGTTIDGAQVESTNILNADQINMNPAQQEPTTSVSEGSLYWDALNHRLRGYDGLSWQGFQMGELTQDPWQGSNQETMDNLTDGYITFSGNNTLKFKLDNLNGVTIEAQKDLILSSLTGNIIAKPKLIFGDPDTGFGELGINEWGDLEANSPAWAFISRRELAVLGNDGENAAIEVYADAGSNGNWEPYFRLASDIDRNKITIDGSPLEINPDLYVGNLNVSGTCSLGALSANSIYARRSQTLINFDSYTKLLLHCDGTQGSTTIIDETGKVVTVFGYLGQLYIDTAEKRFGTGSIYYEPLIPGGYKVLRLAYNSDWNFGSGDFTIDFWVKPSGFGTSLGNIYQRSPETHYLKYIDGQLKWRGPNQTEWATGKTLDIGVWQHIELSYDSANAVYRCFVNGIGTTLPFVSNLPQDVSELQILNGNFSGYMDEFRWSKGICRHTSDFTPETRAYVAMPVVLVENCATLTEDARNSELVLSRNFNLNGFDAIEPVLFIEDKTTATGSFIKAVDKDANTMFEVKKAGELKIKVYSQNDEPTLSADNFMAIWIDTDDNNKVYLIFRRGTGDQVKVELT